MSKKVLFILLFCMHVSAFNQRGIDAMDVIDYIKITGDSIEIKLQTPCVRKVMFDAPAAGMYINETESEIIYADEVRRYYDQLLSLSLNNYDSRYGVYFDRDAPFAIKINTTSHNLYYYIPTLQKSSTMLHVSALLAQSGYRVFYILNQYGADYRKTEWVVVQDELIQLNEPRLIGFKVKSSGYIYIPHRDNEWFDQFIMKVKVLCALDTDFGVTVTKHAVVISLPSYYDKSPVAP